MASHLKEYRALQQDSEDGCHQEDSDINYGRYSHGFELKRSISTAAVTILIVLSLAANIILAARYQALVDSREDRSKSYYGT
jgi:hypothetical protein